MERMGVFDNLEMAAAAVDRLVAAGFAEGQISTVSSVPYPPGVLVHTEERTWFRWVALGGAIIGALSGFALAAGTAWVYPVRTGDKAIIAGFPTAIITYEITMLFAMLGTIIGMFLEMKLPPRGPRLYDEAIAEGMIGVEVLAANEDEERKAVDVLKEAGAVRVAGEAAK